MTEGAGEETGGRPRWWRRPGRRRVLAFVAIGLATPVVLLTLLLAFAYWRIQLPPDHVMAQSTLVCPAGVTATCDDTNAMAAFVGDQDRTNVHLADVSPMLVKAVVAAEDRSFYSHSGIDPIGTMRALFADVRGQQTQGGSTITQQYVKNAYLATSASDRSGLSGVTRKVKEAVLAVKVEQQLSKDQILERYLNTIYFGRGAYGIGAAARVYFGRDAHDLDLAQSAYLAGQVRSPGTGDPVTDPTTATKRRRLVLDSMVAVGAITQAEHDAADAQPWTVATLPDMSDGTVLPPSPHGNVEVRKGAGTGEEYFLDVVHRQLNEAGFSDAEIFSGGLRVYTTLDLAAQQQAWDAVTTTLDQPDDPSAALVTVDRDGAVRAMIGGRDHATDQVNLAMGTAGGGGGRQAGSSFKPFVLAAAVHQGIPLTKTFPAPTQIRIPKADNGHDWVVNNAEPSGGSLDLTSATALSSNTVFAQLIMEVGPDNAIRMAKDLGITTPLDPLPSITLGTASVSPYEMASAYATLARGGEHVTPTVVTKVDRPDGTSVTIQQPRDQVIPTDEATRVTSALRQVVARGTGVGANPGVPAAGKTGTTENNTDAWFVGYLPDGYTTAVWLGYENAPGTPPRTMAKVHGGPVFGGGLPATIWRTYMSAIAKGRDVGQFPDPPPEKSSASSFTPSSDTSDSSSSSSPVPVADTTPTTATDNGKPTTTTASTTTTSTSPTTTSTPPSTAPPATGGAPAGPAPP